MEVGKKLYQDPLFLSINNIINGALKKVKKQKREKWPLGTPRFGATHVGE